MVEAQGDDTRAVFAATPVTEDLLDARLRQRNKLVCLTCAWHGEDDFSDRWSLIVEYRDAATAAEAAARRLSRL
ncbi:hypothetical protein [Streptomyces sp. NPDC015350]|uniref:hypothetical protein n=1 Tax=Streptomyces sp. NPDC015350 TaxID=3364955 RepID=UPI0036FD629A